jgi:hypothetical protein
VTISIPETIRVTETPTFSEIAVPESIHVVDPVSVGVVVSALQSITVTPPNPSIVSGASQTLTATRLYADGSTKNLTSSATWMSSNTAVTTMSGTAATGLGPRGFSTARLQGSAYSPRSCATCEGLCGTSRGSLRKSLEFSERVRGAYPGCRDGLRKARRRSLLC